MSLSTALIVKSSHILAGIYFTFLKKHPRPNLKGFLYQNWTSVISVALILGKNYVKDFRVIKIVKQIKFKRAWGKLEARKCFQRQSWTKYLRQTLGKVQFLFFKSFLLVLAKFSL